MDIRGAVDAAVPTNIIAAKAAEVRANQVNWQSYLQWVHPVNMSLTGHSTRCTCPARDTKPLCREFIFQEVDTFSVFLFKSS